MSPVVPLPDFSPVRLSYVGALRSLRPRPTGKPFTYARLDGCAVEWLTCLAASNPDGRFFGLCETTVACSAAQSFAISRNVMNVVFLNGTLDAVLKDIEAGTSSLPKLDYLCFDERESRLQTETREALYAIAEKAMNDHGFFTVRYRAYENSDENLRFLAQELASEMTPDQAIEFLTELRDLSPDFWAQNPARATALADATTRGAAQDFLAPLTAEKTAISGTFATMEALLPRGFAFVGDATVHGNYLELSTPETAHPVLEEAAEHLLYEVVKDFAMQRTERTDIWVKLPASQSEDIVELFGGFAFGVTQLLETIPPQIQVFSKTLHLDSPLYREMIALMAQQPMAIGDFLHHEKGRAFSGDEVLSAMQILVATGIASPMRTGLRAEAKFDINKPQWACAYNKFLDHLSVATPHVMLASSIVGGPVAVVATDALVLQAINKDGLENAAISLFSEMTRMANDPALANTLLTMPAPTPEAAHEMLSNTIKNAAATWYAYGLLAA